MAVKMMVHPREEIIQLSILLEARIREFDAENNSGWLGIEPELFLPKLMEHVYTVATGMTDYRNAEDADLKDRATTVVNECLDMIAYSMFIINQFRPLVATSYQTEAATIPIGRLQGLTQARYGEHPLLKFAMLEYLEGNMSNRPTSPPKGNMPNKASDQG